MSHSGLYIQLFSVHGLIRGSSPELGRDADTGGQVKYVLELARSLAERPEVDQVDLVTRLIRDKSVSADYGREIEPLSAKARIVRIQCGGRRYVRKELLWPLLDEMVDRTLKLIKSEGRIPDLFHGHYADGGCVARHLSHIFGKPLVFTGHSMGRHKKEKLLEEGMSTDEINRRYHIDHRIAVEERIIKEAEQIVTSTHHEIDRQYGLYDNAEAGRYTVIPPGIDIDIFFPYYDTQIDGHFRDESTRQARMALMDELHRFWVGPQKPFILALCRPDQRKNISGLITAYGEDRELQAIANLAIFAGIRKNIADMEDNERNVLTEMLLLMDRYDLYGKLAIPKKHDFTLEVPELYRMCAESGGVFVNPALVEPFGLTLLEAGCCGLPIVATENGGPGDIVANCENGLLIDPSDTSAIARACRSILVDREAWTTYSRNGINGVRHHYSWASHSERYLQVVGEVRRRMDEEGAASSMTRLPAFGRRLTAIERLVITDVDNTLVGDPESLAQLLDLFDRHRGRLGWGIATGRNLAMTCQALEEHDVPKPDIIISSVGTEIHYGPQLAPDTSWRQHLSHQWKPDVIHAILDGLDFLELQEQETQRRFKISYYIDPLATPDCLALVHKALQAAKVRYHLVFSNGQFLDILPYRASKGKAVRYLSFKWQLPLSHILVAGDSGNDEDMLRGDTSAVVVANYSPELEELRTLRRIHFSDQSHAAGVLDGIRHYQFIEEQS
ncbi:MAG: HAD-IIB family hydrolase [Thermodesulfobacteriota bacterium]